jgi:hypothetical protein
MHLMVEAALLPCKRTLCLVKLVPYRMALHFDYIVTVAKITTGLRVNDQLDYNMDESSAT